jgi:mannose-6-phosphate isomerase-like protein (cupin superfamily)
MVNFIRKKSDKPTFSQKGLDGFQFPLENKNVEVYFVDVKKGHDTFIISKKITHIYYILEGEGFFTINGERIDVKEGSVVEVPPDIEYTYSGSMKLLLIMNPPWFEGNEEVTKKNPSVE